MKLHIFKEYDELSLAAADFFTRAASDAIETRGRFLVALSGGSTPSGLYRLLASEPYRDQVDWGNTFVFWGDERCVPPDDEGSNYFQANEIFLSQVPIPRENIQRIKGELVPYEASKAYAQTLKEYAYSEFDWPRFDLVLLGMGEDGHTASLFPNSQMDFTSPTLAVTAEYQGRPANRVTLTPAVFNSARKILFLVTGPKKATILSYVLGSESTPEQYPVQHIQPTAGQVTWLIDETAGSKL
jgi:6-phosphogluconolactonase